MADLQALLARRRALTERETDEGDGERQMMDTAGFQTSQVETQRHVSWQWESQNIGNSTCEKLYQARKLSAARGGS